MKQAPALLLVGLWAACDAQVGTGYAGEPLARVRGSAIGFSPEDLADGAAVRWNPQRGTALATGPMTALPLDALPPSGLSVSVLATPPDDAYFGFDGEPAIAEGALLLTQAGTVVGTAVDARLVYVDGDTASDSRTAAYLGGALAPGFHLCFARATAELTAPQAYFAMQCGGGDACRTPRLYKLVATPNDLETQVQFFRGSR
jgi:hypothetical protein